jgi:hypothetical protein
MENTSVDNKTEVIRCLRNGINTKSAIGQHVRFGARTIQNLLIELEKTEEIRAERIGLVKHYFMTNAIPFNDPFGLAKPNKNVNTFMLPPRRLHSMDDKREAR